MSSSIAFPFLVLTSESVHSSPWILSAHKEASGINDVLINWDYLVDLNASREIRVDLKGAANSLDISEDELDLELLIQTGTGSAQVPRHVKTHVKQKVKFDEVVKINFILDSSKLSGSLFLMTHILLSTPSGKSGKLSPKRACMRLWSDEHRFPLGQEGMRFPTEMFSFNKAFPGRSYQHATWFLHWISNDPAQDLSSAIRLYLNNDQREFIKRVQDLDDEVMRSIMAGVLSQVVASTFDETDDEVLDYSQGSIGKQAEDWRNLAFPGESLKTVRQIYCERRGEYEAAMLAAAELKRNNR